MSKFTIDFFELMFLAESVIPDRPIARSMCFDDFSDVHYHKMSDSEKEQFFEHVKKCNGFTLENDQCRYFYARFNPKNQYIVHTEFMGTKETHNCFLFDEKYYISKNRFISNEYIIKTERKND